jgi:hypothetical protein
MAGPALRMWEISRVLARHCDVMLVTAHLDAVEPDGFQVSQYTSADLKRFMHWADAIVLDPSVYEIYPEVRRFDRPLAVDLIWPRLLESLELARHAKPADLWELTLLRQVQSSTWFDPLRRGDFFFCGTPRQRDFYLGLLAALGRLNPLTYENDQELRRLIDVVPFGLPGDAPQHTRTVLRGVVPGIGQEDFILLWAGGVWPWLDPWTLLEAMARLIDSSPQIRLFFMGITRPQPETQTQWSNDQLIDRARELNVLDRNVFINTGWIDYHDRANYLLEANVGATTHDCQLETHFSLRTRSFDYVWAGLPILTTTGDWIAELIEQKGLGLTVPPRNPDALAGAIVRLANDAELRQQMRQRMAEQAREWTWDRVCQPLVEFCLAPRLADDRAFWDQHRRKRRWRLKAHYHWRVFRRAGFAELLRSFDSLLPLRRIRVAFRDHGLRAGLHSIGHELRIGEPPPRGQ